MAHARLCWLFALSCLTIAACDNKKDAAPKGRISGPVGTEYSVHPVYQGTGREVIAGCCSFETGKAKVRKLLGDLDGREIAGTNFHATVSFGPRAISTRPVPTGSNSVIDGVDVTKHITNSPDARRPDLIYTAIVPLHAEAEAKRIDPPELEIQGWCEDTRSCHDLTRLMESVRF